MKKIDFSLLMSVYVKEKPEYLKMCLQSIASQTILPNEIILIKDGPLTRELDHLINEFQNEYPNTVKIIANEKNQGLGIVLAQGVELAKNEWIARMDTDDICQPYRFEKQLKQIYENSELGLIGSYIEEFSSDPSKIDGVRQVPLTHEEIIKFARRRNPMNHMTVMYKKSEVLRAGNYQPLLGYEDYYLWVRMLRAGTIAENIKDPLVFARADDDMIRRRGGWKYFKNGVTAFQQIYEVGLSTRLDYIIRITSQLIINLSPGFLRKKIYKNFLRD